MLCIISMDLQRIFGFYKLFTISFERENLSVYKHSTKKSCFQIALILLNTSII